MLKTESERESGESKKEASGWSADARTEGQACACAVNIRRRSSLFLSLSLSSFPGRPAAATAGGPGLVACCGTGDGCLHGTHRVPRPSARALCHHSASEQCLNSDHDAVTDRKKHRGARERNRSGRTTPPPTRPRTKSAMPGAPRAPRRCRARVCLPGQCIPVSKIGADQTDQIRDLH